MILLLLVAAIAAAFIDTRLAAILGIALLLVLVTGRV